MPFVNGMRIVARTDDDRSEFLRKRGFSKAETAKIIETVLAEERRKPESVFDSSRASPQWRGTRPIRMPVSTWRRGRRNCSTEQPDFRKIGDADSRVSGSVPFHLS